MVKITNLYMVFTADYTGKKALDRFSKALKELEEEDQRLNPILYDPAKLKNSNPDSADGQNKG